MGNDDLLLRLAESDPAQVTDDFGVTCRYCGCDLWPGYEQPHLDGCLWMLAREAVGRDSPNG